MERLGGRCKHGCSHEIQGSHIRTVYRCCHSYESVRTKTGSNMRSRSAATTVSLKEVACSARVDV